MLFDNLDWLEEGEVKFELGEKKDVLIGVDGFVVESGAVSETSPRLDEYADVSTGLKRFLPEREEQLSTDKFPSAVVRAFQNGRPMKDEEILDALPENCAPFEEPKVFFVNLYRILLMYGIRASGKGRRVQHIIPGGPNVFYFRGEGGKHAVALVELNSRSTWSVDGIKFNAAPWPPGSRFYVFAGECGLCG